MKIKDAVLGTVSRILRFAGILLVIYVSMVFYLALTERRNAFPRAITHNEAREAITEVPSGMEQDVLQPLPLLVAFPILSLLPISAILQ